MLTSNKKYPVLFIGISCISLFIYLNGCIGVSEKKKHALDSLKVLNVDTVKIATAADSILAYKLNRVVKYSVLRIKGLHTISDLDSIYGKEGRTLILTLNRLDPHNIRRGDSIVIPDTIAHLLSFSPYPFIIDELKDIPKMIFVSRRIQAFACYENGILKKWGPTSTGRKSKPTPDGLFSTNWKKLKTISTIDEEWILPYYFNIMNIDGVAFHQFSMPGYPASHSCVRLLETDAQWLYYWAEQWILTRDGINARAYGTPVVIFGDYKYGTPPPWKNLVNDPESQTIQMTEIQSLMDKYLQTIKERNYKRKLVLLAIEEEKKSRDTLKLSMK